MRGRREGERRSVCDREAAGRWGRGGRGGSGRGLVWVPLRRVDGRKKSNEQVKNRRGVLTSVFIRVLLSSSFFSSSCLS